MAPWGPGPNPAGIQNKFPLLISYLVELYRERERDVVISSKTERRAKDTRHLLTWQPCLWIPNACGFCEVKGQNILLMGRGSLFISCASTCILKLFSYHMTDGPNLLNHRSGNIKQKVILLALCTCLGVLLLSRSGFSVQSRVIWSLAPETGGWSCLEMHMVGWTVLPSEWTMTITVELVRKVLHEGFLYVLTDGVTCALPNL